MGFFRFPTMHQKLLGEERFVGARPTPVGDDEAFEMISNELFHELSLIHIQHGGVDAESLE